MRSEIFGVGLQVEPNRVESKFFGSRSGSFSLHILVFEAVRRTFGVCEGFFRREKHSFLTGRFRSFTLFLKFYFYLPNLTFFSFLREVVNWLITGDHAVTPIRLSVGLSETEIMETIFDRFCQQYQFSGPLLGYIDWQYQYGCCGS